MKKILLFIMLLIMSVAAFSQETKPSPTLTKQEYIQKSKNQKTTAFILLGVGATAIAIAAPGNVSLDLLPVLVIVGGVAAIVSIPLFIASARNKRKGMSLSFKNVPAPQIQKRSFVYQTVPSLTLKINL